MSQFTNKDSSKKNGNEIHIDLQKLAKYSSDEITYLYAHTLLHIALKHPYRQKTREKKLWNQACDMVINLILSSFSNRVQSSSEYSSVEFENKVLKVKYNNLNNIVNAFKLLFSSLYVTVFFTCPM